MVKFKAGDNAFMLESNCIVREVAVVRSSGGIYLIKFSDGGGIQVKEHRLFATEEGSKAAMPGKRKNPRGIIHIFMNIKNQNWETNL